MDQKQEMTDKFQIKFGSFGRRLKRTDSLFILWNKKIMNRQMRAWFGNEVMIGEIEALYVLVHA